MTVREDLCWTVRYETELLFIGGLIIECDINELWQGDDPVPQTFPLPDTLYWFEHVRLEHLGLVTVFNTSLSAVHCW